MIAWIVVGYLVLCMTLGAYVLSDNPGGKFHQEFIGMFIIPFAFLVGLVQGRYDWWKAR